MTGSRMLSSVTAWLLALLVLLAGCSTTEEDPGTTDSGAGQEADTSVAPLERAADLRTAAEDDMGPGGRANGMDIAMTMEMEMDGETMHAEATATAELHEGDAMSMVMDMVQTGSDSEVTMRMLITCQDGLMRTRVTSDGQEPHEQETRSETGTCHGQGSGPGSLLGGQFGIDLPDTEDAYDAAQLEGDALVASYAFDGDGMNLTATDRYVDGRLASSDLQMTMVMEGDMPMRMVMDLHTVVHYGARTPFPDDADA